MDRVARKGFSRAAGEYERSRPTYPFAVAKFAQRTFQLTPTSLAVDLAAGTGKWTRVLQQTGCQVLAIEPLPAMRREFRRAVPGVPVRPGTAEWTGLATASVDLVTVAQAFHWFDAVPAVREIRRVLRPGGGVMVLWNNRVHPRSWRRSLRKILAPYERKDLPRTSWRGWRTAFVAKNGYTRLRRRDFPPFSQRFTVDEFLERLTSVSYIASLPKREREGLLARVRSLMATHPATRGKRTILIQYRPEVYWTFARAPGRRPASRRAGVVGRATKGPRRRPSATN